MARELKKHWPLSNKYRIYTKCGIFAGADGSYVRWSGNHKGVTCKTCQKLIGSKK